MSKVLFLHGLGSKPGGTKPKYLEKHGFSVFNPHLPKSSWKESLETAQKIIDEEEPDVIVGSSRGGAVAMTVNTYNSKLVLIAPAWKRFQVAPSIPGSTIILHSPYDDIVMFKDSNQLKEQCNVTLISCGKTHRMNDDEALDALLDAVKWSTKS